MSYDHDLPVELRFATKAEPREMTLYDAYMVIKRFRDELVKLQKNDLFLSQGQKRKIHWELLDIDNWLSLTEKKLIIKFELPDEKPTT